MQAALTTAAVCVPYSIVLRAYTELMALPSLLVLCSAPVAVGVLAVDFARSGVCCWLVADQSSVTVQRAAQCADVCILGVCLLAGGVADFTSDTVFSLVLPVSTFFVANTVAGNTSLSKRTYKAWDVYRSEVASINK
jgi:hypothetical protein